MNAIVSLAIGAESCALAEMTFPIMRRYAARCAAECVLIERTKVFAGHSKFEKLQLFDLLFEYDRILFLDIDTLVLPACPNVFDVVPENVFGAFFDSSGANGDADMPGDLRELEMAIYQKEYGDIGWTKDYFNSGVMLVPGSAKDMFRYGPPIKRIGRFVDQSYLNYRLQKSRHPYVDIGQKYNHFAALSRSSRLMSERFNSYIIHYAGFSDFYPECSLISLVKEDVTAIYCK